MIAYGGGSSFTAWGLPGSPQWFEHDPNANPGRLRDVEVFVGSASGTPRAPSMAPTAPPSGSAPAQ